MSTSPLDLAKNQKSLDLLQKGWGRIMIGGNILPGRCSVNAASLKKLVDPKKPQGKHGGKPTAQGNELQEFWVDIELRNDAERAEYRTVHQKIGPLPGVEVKALSFDADAVRHLGIESVIVVESTSQDLVSVGVTRTRLKLRHWLKPIAKSATTTPTVQAPSNARAADAAKHNPKPTDQPNAGAPVMNLQAPASS
jgi:hypothetical protein